jgi:SAM-dependent methyltransferase
VSTDDTRARWDAEAATFDDEPDHGLADPATRAAWRELLLEHLPPAPARVADLGCGTGTLAVLLAAEGYDVRGIDLSPQMVARAEAKAAAAGVTATFAVGDASDPQLPARSFDVVLSRHVLWALPDPAAGLARWVELLAPGGRLLLVEGRWFTGGGLTSAQTEALVHGTGRSVAVRHLPDPVYWGREISDERYLAVSVG